jgi:hypothetical protein
MNRTKCAASDAFASRINVLSLLRFGLNPADAGVDRGGLTQLFQPPDAANLPSKDQELARHAMSSPCLGPSGLAARSAMRAVLLGLVSRAVASYDERVTKAQSWKD